MTSRIAVLMPSWLRKIASYTLFRSRRVRNYICGIDRFAKQSYSQEGEDIILGRLFPNRDSGFYIDVGAHHPRRFSNTYFFYKQGWRGINIEPNPDMMIGFSKERGEDQNLQMGIHERRGKLQYFKFNDPALNTFDAELARQRVETTSYSVVETIEVQVDRLEAVLAQHVPVNVNIDFLSIDVEGLDLSVLKSNDWNRFRPRIVLAEEISSSLSSVVNGKIASFMVKQKYELFAKTFNTLFFRDVTIDPGN